MPSQPAFNNRVLRRLAPDDLDAIFPYLVSVSLRSRLSFEKPDRPIEQVCFPESGIVSIVAETNGDKGIEAGVVGFEGMTGLPLIFGDDRWPNSTYVQSPGNGFVMDASVVAKLLAERPGFRTICLRYAKTFLIQTSQTALANGRANVAQRLARWLLMAQDRLLSDDVALTHEFLSLMLGVRRSGVTEQLQEFNVKGLVETERGLVRILDRARLLDLAGNYYGVPERDYARLLGD